MAKTYVEVDDGGRVKHQTTRGDNDPVPPSYIEVVDQNVAKELLGGRVYDPQTQTFAPRDPANRYIAVKDVLDSFTPAEYNAIIRADPNVDDSLAHAVAVLMASQYVKIGVAPLSLVASRAVTAGKISSARATALRAAWSAAAV